MAIIPKISFQVQHRNGHYIQLIYRLLLLHQTFVLNFYIFRAAIIIISLLINKNGIYFLLFVYDKVRFFSLIMIKELYTHFLKYPLVCIDTRDIQPGSIFFALKGANFNANQFAEKAIQSGCSLAVID